MSQHHIKINGENIYISLSSIDEIIAEFSKQGVSQNEIVKKLKDAIALVASSGFSPRGATKIISERDFTETMIKKFGIFKLDQTKVFSHVLGQDTTKKNQELHIITSDHFRTSRERLSLISQDMGVSDWDVKKQSDMWSFVHEEKKFAAVPLGGLSQMLKAWAGRKVFIEFI
jgi:hypothetical protein